MKGRREVSDPASQNHTNETKHTKRPNSIQPIRILHTPKLQAPSIPLPQLSLSQQPLLPKLPLGTPTNITHDPRNLPRPPIRYEINVIEVASGSEEGEEEVVGGGREGGGDVFFVEDVV